MVSHASHFTQINRQILCLPIQVKVLWHLTQACGVCRAYPFWADNQFSLPLPVLGRQPVLPPLTHFGLTTSSPSPYPFWADNQFSLPLPVLGRQPVLPPLTRFGPTTSSPSPRWLRMMACWPSRTVLNFIVAD